MTEPSNTLKFNPVIDAIKANADGRIQKLTGYLSKGTAGKVELYLELSAETYLEFNERDVIHVVDADKPTDPSLVFVRDHAGIVIHFRTTAADIASVGSRKCGCSSSAGSTERFLARRKGSTTGDPELDCALAWAACRINCWLKHPDDPLMQQGCNDNCDAARRLCLDYPGGVGGNIFI